MASDCERVQEERVVLLRLVEAQRVHVVPAAKPRSLAPAQELRPGPAEPTVEPRQRLDGPLVGDGGEDGLVQLLVDEAALVQAEELLGQRGSAAGRRDDEDRLLEPLPPEPGKEDVVQQPPEQHEAEERQEQPAEEQHEGEAPEPKRQPEQREALGLEKQAEVEVQGSRLPGAAGARAEDPRLLGTVKARAASRGGPRRVSRLSGRTRRGGGRRWRRGLWAAVAALGVALAAPLAHAHAIVKRTTLEGTPVRANAATSVTLYFNSRIEPAFTRVTLVDEMRQERELEVAPAEKGDAVTVRLPALPPGSYGLRYKVLAVDGHVTESLLRFPVQPPE